MNVYCAAVECKYNGNKNRCTAKNINLSSHNIMTLWDGRQDFWKCKNYELYERAAAMMEHLRKIGDNKNV